MGLLELIIVLAVIGLVVYLITTYIPMAPPIRQIIIVVVVLVLIVWLVRTFIGDIPLPTRR